MDGRRRCLDNIFIERLWRSLKQEAIYLEEIADGFKARRGIKGWMALYNTKCPIRHMIGSRPTWHIGSAWKSKKLHET